MIWVKKQEECSCLSWTMHNHPCLVMQELYTRHRLNPVAGALFNRCLIKNWRKEYETWIEKSKSVR